MPKKQKESIAMTTQINATYHVTNWDEKAYLEIDPEKKLTRANVQQKISGDIEGEGCVDYLMCYQQNQSASYKLHRITTHCWKDR